MPVEPVTFTGPSFKDWPAAKGSEEHPHLVCIEVFGGQEGTAILTFGYSPPPKQQD